MQVDYDIGQPKMACQVASLTYYFLFLIIAFNLKESSRDISIHYDTIWKKWYESITPNASKLDSME